MTKIDSFAFSVLENFATINTQVWINEGNVLETVAPSKSIVARATVDTVFPKTFGLYHLNRFIQALSLYNEPDVTFEDTRLVVSSGMRSTKFSYGDPVLFKPCRIPDKMTFPSSDIKASISSVVIRDLEKAARILGVEFFVIQGNGEVLTVSALDVEDPGSNYHRIQLGETDKKFKAVVKASNMLLLPLDYEIEVIPHEDRPSLKFVSDRIQYLVALDESSEI